MHHRTPSITILGSGTFFTTSTVSASSFVVDTAQARILVDAGPGTLVKLAKAGIQWSTLDHIFITHFHADHTADLFSLFMDYRLTDLFEPGKLKKFPIIHGPPGMDDFMLRMSKLLEMETYEGWGKIEVREYVEDNNALDLGDLVITAYPVSHEIFGVQARAYALRIKIGDTLVAISGDTVDCPGVRDACRNTDLFLCDASFPKGMVNKAHMNTHDIGNIATECSTKEVLLYHLYPQYTDVDLVSEVREKYDGPVRKVRDLEVIQLKQ